MTAQANPESTADRELVLSRDFDAPRELVWQAMTDPKHVSNWWGPNGFTDTIDTMDFRVGGVWKHTLHGPDGTNYPNKSIFREIVKHERVVFTHGAGREDKENPGATFTASWTFEALAPKRTRLTLRMVFPTAAKRDEVVKNYGAVEGGKQTLGKLAVYLEGNLEALADSSLDFVLTRTFDAPREVVWDAWTDPVQMAQWWGPKDFNNPVCEMDVRVGGKFHLGMTAADGSAYPLTGTFKEVNKPARLVMSMKVEPHSSELKETVNLDQAFTFEDLGGRTRLTIRSRFPDAATRDHFLKMGMSEGWSQSLDRLDAVATKKDIPLVIERTYHAPAAKVWQALTSKEAMKEWYFDLKEFKPQVGFEFGFVVEHEGNTYDHRCKITQVELGKKLAYSWRYEGQGGNSEVTWELLPEGDQTTVRLTHTGLGSFPPVKAYARNNFLGGWTEILGTNLRKFVEKS